MKYKMSINNWTFFQWIFEPKFLIIIRPGEFIQIPVIILIIFKNILEYIPQLLQRYERVLEYIPQYLENAIEIV